MTTRKITAKVLAEYNELMDMVDYGTYSAEDVKEQGITLKDIINEAKHFLSTYMESGHSNHELKLYDRKQWGYEVKCFKDFIKKYDTSTSAPTPQRGVPKYRQDNGYFHYHNANPKNRKQAGDCVYRAVSFALNIPWEMALKDLCDMARVICYAPADKKTVERYIKNTYNILMEKQPRKDDNTKYTLKEFALEHRHSKSRFLVSVANHMTVVFQGKVWDTWDCSNYTVGNYWEIK